MKKKSTSKCLVLIFLLSLASLDLFGQSLQTYYDPPGPTGLTLTCSQCSDGSDGDGDGLIGCADPDCVADCNGTCPVLIESQCNDGIDNDGDGLVDGCDPNCTGTCYFQPNKYWKVSNIAGTQCTSCTDVTCNDVVFTLSSGYGQATTVGADFTATAGVEGNRVLIIQMRAGSAGVIDRTKSTSAYGTVSNVGGAGSYEFATVASVTASTLTFVDPLVNTYDFATGQVQIIPVYGYGSASLTISNVTIPLAYNTTLGVGGVLVMQSSGTITLNADLIADGKGFKGGDTIGNVNSTNYIQNACCGSFVAGGGTAMDATNANMFAFPLVLSEARNGACGTTTIRIDKGARKGSGIFGVFAGEELSKGKVANGGGGAHGYNSGGGGGGGYQGGGQGGYELAWACNNSGTAGLDHGGRGGQGYMGGTTALFMGGGGGAGHGDGNNGGPYAAGAYPAGTYKGPTSGGNGGGIIIVKANQITASGSRRISAKGLSGGIAYQDGAGGGGGGGSIILEVPTYSGTLAVDGGGGDAGNVINPNSADCHGTGGGGGGGRVILSVGSAPGGVSINTSGGLAGKLLKISGGVPVDKVAGEYCGSNISWGAVAGSSLAPTFSTTINTTSCPASAPVTLINFYASLTTDNNSEIYWKTASEINASYYAVERSSDGQNFEEIGSVQAHGNSNQVLSYSFTDEKVSSSTEHVYYRLRMVDLNGAFEYSNTITLKLKGSLISVYPNPIKGESGVNIIYQSETESELTTELLDLLGRHLDSRLVKLNKGSNEFILNTQGAPSGIYFIYLSDKFGKTIEKLIIE